MTSVAATGVQAANIGSIHSLTTITTPGVYVLAVNMVNMANGDSVKLALKTIVESGGTLQPAYERLWTNAQYEKNKYSIPIPVTHSIEPTLQQTAGTGRNFAWELIAL